MTLHSSDDEQTILRPNPSGRRSGNSGLPHRIKPLIDAECNHALSDAGPRGNTLLLRATPLLTIVVALKTTASNVDPEQLKTNLESEMKSIQRDLRELHMDEEVIEWATFALASYVDEVILSTPWAEKARWADSGLLSKLFRVGWGGERVADMLEQVTKGTHSELAVLFLAILDLGYQGQFGILKDGATQRNVLIGDLQRQVVKKESLSALELATKFNKAAPSVLNWKDRIPAWVTASVVMFLLIALWAGVKGGLEYRASNVALSSLSNQMASQGGAR